MTHSYHNLKTSAVFNMIVKPEVFIQQFNHRNPAQLLTIIWNNSEDQKIKIDNVEYEFPKQSILPLVNNSSFELSRPELTISWQFNREFYCIIDHDKEVSCAGFIFYGGTNQMFIDLDDSASKKFDLLYKVFLEEMEEKDNIQGEMLRMLLKRLIILMTRLGKQQYANEDSGSNVEIDIIREFNLHVEKKYKELHQVKDYASLLNKSPKTLSNIFAKHNQKSPLKVIKDRITLEAKRLFMYTDMNAKEVSFQLGFDDPTGFSRFFKNQTGHSPSNFRKLKPTQT